MVRLNSPGRLGTQLAVPSTVRGGSAVMFGRDRVVKSGGGTRGACGVSGGAPLATTEVLDLSTPDPEFEDTGFPMHQRRHFHTLTVLPDGAVLATGGNSCGNGESGTGGLSCFADENTGFECTEGSLGCIEVTSIPCDIKTDCPDWATCGSAVMPDCPEGSECTCNPGNNACYATRAAELWDPQSKRWCLMAEASFERMYHSTALLMPDGRVLSTGSGRRQGLANWETAEFFSPPYLLDGGARPEVEAINGVTVPSIPEVAWSDVLTLTLGGTTTFDDVGRVTLVRLGSVTHSNDMNQRFLDLGCFWPAGQDETGRPRLGVNTPETPNVAPPGHYMVFVLNEQGTPSAGHYIKLGDPS